MFLKWILFCLSRYLREKVRRENFCFDFCVKGLIHFRIFSSRHQVIFKFGLQGVVQGIPTKNQLPGDSPGGRRRAWYG